MHEQLRYHLNLCILDASLDSFVEAISSGDSVKADKFYNYALRAGKKALGLADENTADLSRVEDALEITKEIYRNFQAKNQTVFSGKLRDALKSAQDVDFIPTRFKP